MDLTVTARSNDILAGTTADTRECDDAIRRDLIDLLGDAGVSALLHKLSAQLEDRLDDAKLDTTDRERIASNAHTLVSAAGMLGFSRFSTLCARLENACRTGLPLDPIRSEVRSARDRVAAEIASGRPGATR